MKFTEARSHSEHFVTGMFSKTLVIRLPGSFLKMPAVLFYLWVLNKETEGSVLLFPIWKMGTRRHTFWEH